MVLVVVNNYWNKLITISSMHAVVFLLMGQIQSCFRACQKMNRQRTPMWKSLNIGAYFKWHLYNFSQLSALLILLGKRTITLYVFKQCADQKCHSNQTIQLTAKLMWTFQGSCGSLKSQKLKVWNLSFMNLRPVKCLEYVYFSARHKFFDDF